MEERPPGVLSQALGKGRCVLFDLPLQPFKGFRLGDLEGYRHGREFLSVGATLLAGEHGHIDPIGHLLVCGHDDRAAGAAQGLVGGKGRHVGDAYRAGKGPGDGHARRTQVGTVAELTKR